MRNCARSCCYFLALVHADHDRHVGGWGMLGAEAVGRGGGDRGGGGDDGGRVQ